MTCFLIYFGLLVFYYVSSVSFFFNYLFECLFAGVISFSKFLASTSDAGFFLSRAFGPQLPKGLRKKEQLYELFFFCLLFENTG